MGSLKTVDAGSTIEISMSWTFYLQDSDSGLFLTNPGDSNNVKLEEQNFSINQTWYWGEAGNRLICGTGRVMEAEYGCMVSMSSWPYPSVKQNFRIEKDDCFISIAHEDKYLVNSGDNQVGLKENNPIAWRQIPTNQGYHWKEVGEYEDFPENSIIGIGDGGAANYSFGRGYRNGTLHMGLACKNKNYMGEYLERLLGYHDESLMSKMPFYLKHKDSGEYLTCSTEKYDDVLKLAPLDYCPGQIWKWTNKQDDGRFILSNATYTLVNCAQCPEGPAMKTNSYSIPPESSVLFTLFKQKGGTLIIANDVENEIVFGVKEMYGMKMATLGKAKDEDIQYMWEVVPVEQSYRWCAMDSTELPGSAICAGKAEDGGSDIYVGRGQVNGILHLGTVTDGNRMIGFSCKSSRGEMQHCSHCCNREKCQNSDNSNEDNIKEVETEAFSVLCAKEEAQWVEYNNGSPPSAYTVDWSVFPKKAVVAGVKSNGSVVYVGRGTIDGQIVTGFFAPSYEHTKLTVFHQGKIHQIEDFEALVLGGNFVPDKVDKDVSYFGVDNIAKDVTDEKFSLLCMDDGTIQEWVDYQEDNLPDRAVIAGVFNDNVYYVGRQKEENVPGMFLPRRTMKYSDEDIPHKLYVINNNDKGIKKISQLAKFEVLVAKPAPCRLIIKKEGVSTPAGYIVLDTNDDIFEDNWEKIKVALKDELKKGTMQIALRKDIH